MTRIEEKKIYEALANVMDPEIPVLSVIDLGIVGSVTLDEQEILVRITPTFSGCPALDVISENIKTGLAGFNLPVEVEVDLKNKWSTNLMTEEGKRKLEEFGLAPPAKIKGEVEAADLERVRCPLCKSTDTTLNTPFGSTLCRAIRFCFNCKQGFEQFKPL